VAAQVRDQVNKTNNVEPGEVLTATAVIALTISRWRGGTHE
jgi:hypothetical protein